jgi:methyl coenzyme M reductase alpha subunit
VADLDERYLEERYAGPSRAQRMVAALVVAALLAAGAGLLGWAVVVHSNPEVQSRLTAFVIPDDHTAQATIAVSRKAEDTVATCRLQAVAEDHAVVGQQTLRVADGPAEQSLRLQLRTERRATTVELLGCTTPDQPRPR